MTTLRCSELDRVLACPGSITLCSLVDARDGDEGGEGSALHLDAAIKIVRDLGGSAPDGLPAPDPQWPSLKFSRWIADYYFRHVRDNVPQGWSLEVEVGLSYEFDGFILSGHIDCCAVSPDGTEAMGWDLKSGHDPVDEAEQNWQMIAYCCLLIRAYPKLRRVVFFVVQPRNDEDEGYQRISSVALGYEMHLPAILDNLERKIKEALSSPMLVNTGRTQCRWCPAALQCPALQADRDLMKMTLTAEALAAIQRQPDDATLADWVISGRTLARPTEDAQELAKARIREQGSIVAKDGTVISAKVTRGSYTCTDKPGMFNAVSEILPTERLAKTVKFSMTALRDEVAQHMGIPVTGKGDTGTSVVERVTGAFVEQGERVLFQFR